MHHPPEPQWGPTVSTVGAMSAQRSVAVDRRRGRPVVPSPTIKLQVLGAFRLTVDETDVRIPKPAQRLLVLLVVRRHRLLRTFAAGLLWLDLPEQRAAANLRSVLWRLRAIHVPVVDTRDGMVSLMPDVSVDVYETAALARRWLAGAETEADLDAGSAILEGELLPDWYEEWVGDERDRYRQLRVHALEVIAERLASIGRWGAAVQAALAALAADPLRESAHRAVIRVYLAEGNVAEAIRQLRRCERLLIEEVGIRPSFNLDDLMPSQAR